MIKKITLIILISTLCLLSGCNNEKKVENSNNEHVNVVTKSDMPVDKSNDSNLNTQIKTEDISACIPEGWHLLVKEHEEEPVSADGDLNKDGFNDKAIVIEKDNDTEIDDSESDSEDVESEEIDFLSAPRQLLIFIGDKNGTYSLGLKSENSILTEIEGGPFGEPIDCIEIKNGSLFLKFMGGSSERWYSSYQFRYQDNDWYLIGATEGGFVEVKGEMDNVEEDYNLLTGGYISRSLENGEIVTTKGNRGVHELVKLKDFNIHIENKSEF